MITRSTEDNEAAARLKVEKQPADILDWDKLCRELKKLRTSALNAPRSPARPQSLCRRGAVSNGAHESLAEISHDALPGTLLQRTERDSRMVWL